MLKAYFSEKPIKGRIIGSLIGSSLLSIVVAFLFVQILNNGEPIVPSSIGWNFAILIFMTLIFFCAINLKYIQRRNLMRQNNFQKSKGPKHINAVKNVSINVTRVREEIW